MVSRNSYFVGLFAVLLLFSTDAFSLHTRNVRTRRTVAVRRHVRRVTWRPLFRGSHDMLVRQNELIDRLELPRIEDEDSLVEMEENRLLVPVRETRALVVDDKLAPNRRYCRPWTREFLEDLSEAYYQKFRKQLRVTSLVRTAEQQKKLRRRNRNAGPVDGETASTHLTGITVDIARKGMSRKEHQWLEEYLLPLREQGLIDPVEERRQPVFHIVVFGSYSDWREAKKLGIDADGGPKAMPE